MLRVALVRGGLSGVITGLVGMGRVVSGGTDPNGAYGQAVILSLIAGAVTITTALIYVYVPYLLKKRAQRDPAFRQSQNEATDALVSELVRKEREIQKLERRLAERDRRNAATTADDGDEEGVPGRRRAPRRDDHLE
jgi:hypothetical protein